MANFWLVGDIEFKPGDPKTVYATIPQRVMVSTDEGLTFAALNQSLNDELRKQETNLPDEKLISYSVPDLVQIKSNACRNVVRSV